MPHVDRIKDGVSETVETRLIDYQRTILRLKLEKMIFLNLFIDYFPEVFGNVVIYGAGVVGKMLLRCCKTPPVAFIDAKQDIKDICGIKVYHIDDDLSDLLKEVNTIIVTPIWAYGDIKVQMASYAPNVNIVSLDKLVEKL